jgi:hypothetical protein
MGPPCRGRRNPRRRRVGKWNWRRLCCMAVVLPAACVAACGSSGTVSSGQVVSGDRFVKHLSFDGGSFTIDPPDGSSPSPSRSTAIADFLSADHAGPSFVIPQAIGWSRVTLRDASGQTFDGFDRRLAWAIVIKAATGQLCGALSAFHPHAHGRTATAQTIPTSTPVRVFVLAPNGDAAIYSDVGSETSCGTTAPVSPEVVRTYQLVSVPWSVDADTRVRADVPDCVVPARTPQVDQSYNSTVLAVDASRPYAPQTCAKTRPVVLDDALLTAKTHPAAVGVVNCWHLTDNPVTPVRAPSDVACAAAQGS